MSIDNIRHLDSSIIIPAYNNRELLNKNLPKLISAKDKRENKIVEIIIVDDASTDGSYEDIKRRFPSVKIIRHRVNRGFSASVNTGARAAKGKILVLLNSDVVPSIDFLEPVYKHFFQDNIFGISLHEKGYSWAKGIFKRGFVEHSQGKSKASVHESFWVNGGSGAIRRDYWMKLGGFDEKLFSPFYWEDIDLCYRAQKRGLISLWEPKAIVFHEHESTIRNLPRRYVQRVQERNQLLFIWKNITSPILFRKHLVGLMQRIIKNPGYIKILLMALTKIRVVMKARYKEKKESRVSDEAIFAKFANFH